MDAIDIESWVEAEKDPGRKGFRQAVHLVLRAIAQSSVLAPTMIMKGGILLAIRYQSTRFTTDVDFSTPQRFQDVDIGALLNSIQDALAPVSIDNDYGLALRLQSHAVKPSNRPDVTFPTLQLRIGYARRLDARQMQRLQTKAAANIVQIDYSFNEWACDIERQPLDGGELAMYPFADLIAEKLRSVLQQPIRKRARYQDIYDLFLLLTETACKAADKEEVLEKLRLAAEHKVPLLRTAMRDPDVIRLSRQDYEGALPALVAIAPPPFDEAYGLVTDFFESLPWPTT